MKIIAVLSSIGISVLCVASFIGASRASVPLKLRKTAMKSVAFVPAECPDCVVEVKGPAIASLSVPVELNVTLANRGATPLAYLLINEAFTIGLRNLDEGKECPPTELGKTTYARPPAGKRLLVRCCEVSLAPGETLEWKVDLTEVFALSAADFEVDVGFELKVPNVGRVSIVSPPIQIEIE